ncbi:MAG: HAMP domain-containing histidine kinase, partial [Pirellulales bacterium]|nr:HAMP domain-containing histidine kinase [Pirellulales bacterium]
DRTLRLERLAAIGQMVSVLTHESRNSLQLIQANLEMLGMEIEDRPEALDYVSRIQAAQDRLQRLFEELREFASPISLDVDACSLGHLVGVVLNELSSLHPEKRIRLREQAEGIDLQCMADPFRMHQVLRNLLENSIAACPDPVSIKAHWSHTELDNRPALRLSLSDNGPGLSAEQREKVFEPFFTTKPKGTGLGLAITKRIIESHGGQIAVGNNGSTGAEFRITLPRRASCA